MSWSLMLGPFVPKKQKVIVFSLKIEGREGLAFK